jgi:hypothetical protein
VEDWGSTQLRHHFRQQGIQIGNEKIDVAHDVVEVHAVSSGWDIKAVLLCDDADIDGALFTADSWKWTDDKATVTYYCDSETDVQQELRERADDELVPVVAKETVFSEDMIDLTSVRIQDEFADRVSLEV